MHGQDNCIQQTVDSLLKKGVVLSILWLAGVGSLIALVLGLRAKRLIEHQKVSPLAWVVFGGVWLSVVWGW